MQPQRQFGKFDGHRIRVYAINAGLDNPSSPIGDFSISTAGYSRGTLRLIGRTLNVRIPRALSVDRSIRLEKCTHSIRFIYERRVSDNFLGQKIDYFDQKMATAHSRIQHFEL